jgi:hypothetical protein
MSRATLNIWLSKRRRGDYRRRVHPVKHGFRKIDPARLRLHIEAHPDAYLWEIGDAFGVTDVAILKACRRLKITRKQNRPV